MTAPVPVIHIITKLEFGGAQQNTLYTVSALDRERFTPVLLTGSEGYLMDEARGLAEERKVALEIVPGMERSIRPGRDWAAYREIVGLLDPYRGGPAIVHSHSSKAGILGRWAAWKAGIPVVIHSIHGFGFTPAQSPAKRWLFMTAEKATSKITDHFIAVSHANRKEGLRLGLFPPGGCTVIRSGFDLDLFRTAEKMSLNLSTIINIPETSPVVLMVACLKPQKAPLDFVRVAARVHERIPDARFILAGDGELKNAISNEINHLGLSGIVLPLGWREDIPQLMKSSRVVVLTSLWEGLPRVIPQAMAAGRPVVASAVDGSVEAVRDGVDGYLCEPGDVKTMAERVTALLLDPDKAAAMGRAGQGAVGEFDRDLMVRQQEELYEQLLKEKGLW
ncbi:MAG: glycosyltransferase family 4 protein [bacterium]|nr:glycosyltransferase family 4 protein [bacterium]MDT8394978.1 glycosyltransferase family 4 protein [bacterium]